MKAFLKLVPVFFLLLSLTACDKTKRCALQDKAVNAASEAIAKGLDCSGIDAIKKDLDKILSKTGFCKRTSEPAVELAGDGTVSVLCQMLVGPVLDIIVDKAIPDAWACTGGKGEAELEKLLIEQCKKINL